MTTTNNLLTLPTLSELKLIGGYSGLNRPMKWVYSILSQPFSNWVNYGDLIFYNAAGRDTSEKMLISAVEEAHRCKLAGIIFLLDENLLPSIPKSIGICADKLAFPVFTLPITSNINNIQHDIIMHIINNEEKWDKSTKFWSDLLFGDCEPNQDQLLNNAYHSDINPKMQFSLYLIQFCNVLEYCNMPVQQKQVDHPSSILSGFYSRVDYLLSQSLHEYWLINHQESCIVIMPVSSTPSDGAPFIKIAQELEHQYVKAHIRISKGSLITDLKNIKKSYQEAQRANLIHLKIPEIWKYLCIHNVFFCKPRVEFDIIFHIPCIQLPELSKCHIQIVLLPYFIIPLIIKCFPLCCKASFLYLFIFPGPVLTIEFDEPGACLTVFISWHIHHLLLSICRSRCLSRIAPAPASASIFLPVAYPASLIP